MVSPNPDCKESIKNMATIFLSYRRTDSPQACRVYEWLARRFGKDAVFMDVAAIPYAVDYSDFIRQAIEDSRIMIVLIGDGWLPNTQDIDDPVRMEMETALANQVPLLPVLIGNTTMPDPDDLPTSISAVALQNALTVGISHDFHTHMQALLPKIESILRILALPSTVTADPDIIYHACRGIIDYLKERYAPVEKVVRWNVDWKVVGRASLPQRSVCATLFMHRAVRLGELLELHFIVSFWGHAAINEHRLAGWVMRQLEQTPVIPDEFFAAGSKPAGCSLKIRRSDEDPRQIWKMITDEPLCLSQAYVATVSPRTRDSAASQPVVDA